MDLGSPSSRVGNTRTAHSTPIACRWGPIFEATVYPEEHPEVSELLKHIVAFDSVDDEGQMEVSIVFNNITIV